MATTSDRPVEIELKYRVVDRAAGHRLLAGAALGPLQATGPARTTQHEDHYVDTADWALARAGFAARLRQSAGGTIISVKSIRSAIEGSMHRREELEGAADRSAPPHDWPGSAARSLILELGGDAPLVELVTLRQLRRKRRYAADGTDVELSLDEVDVVDRGRIVDRFIELEIELVAGDVEPLEALQEILDTDPGLVPSTASKFELALDTAGISPAREPVGAAVGGSRARAEARGPRATRRSRAAGRGDGRAATERSSAADPSNGAGRGSTIPGQAPPPSMPGPRPTDRSAPTPEAETSTAVAAAPGAVDPGEATPETETSTAAAAAPGEAAPTTTATPAAPGEVTPGEVTPGEVTPGEAAPTTTATRAAPGAVDPGEATPETETSTAAAAAPGEAAPGEAAATDASVAKTTAAGSPVEAEIPRLVVGKTPGVQADDTLAEAGRKVLRFHLARMLAREPGTRSGAEPEELHGMRVATRRMRAAWRVFGDAYRPGRTRRYRRDLRDVAARLGAVRDLDVLIEGLASYQATVPPADHAAFEPLMASWRTRRDEARILLLRTLDSDRYRRFVEEYREFVLTEGLAVLPVSPTTPHRVRDSMPSRIWTAYEHVRAYEPVLRWADVETLHDLRIAAKWLRYTVEFVREPLGPEASPLIARVVALQDHLGYLHDADVAANLARAYLVEHAGELSEVETAAIGRYLIDRERELQRLRRTVGAPWRRVAGLYYRRQLGRVIASL